MDLKQVLHQVKNLAKNAGDFILHERQNFSQDVVERKGHQDFVSFVDKESEKMLVEELRLIIPNSGFIAEEKTAGYTNEEYLWIIDPLDGTTNYIHGVAPFAISIALQRNKKTILGLVYELGQREMFYSIEGDSAYCNGEMLRVSTAKGISDGLISTGFHINDYSRLEGHLQVVKKVVENSHGLRRHGSAATDLAYVAAGRFDGFFEYGLSPWDVAAGAFLVEQAGGKVSDYQDGNNYFFGREILAGNLQVHQNMLDLIKTHM